MKVLFTLCLSILTLIDLCGQAEERYQLIIGPDTISMQPDMQYIYVDGSGKELPIRLIKQEILHYTGTVAAFEYPQAYTLASIPMEQGVNMTSLITEDGSGFFVQEFNGQDPSEMIGVMMEELTKDLLAQGYQYHEEVFQRYSRNKQLLLGRKRTLVYMGKVETFTVAAYNNDANGALVVSRTNNFGNTQETKKILDLFFSTLVLK